jgi:cytochrome c oxidase assembly factor CtaG
VTVVPAVLAAAYHGPPPLTATRVFTQWTLDPWALAVVLLLGAFYLAGVRRVRQSGQRWPIGRLIAFCILGLGFAVLATMSCLGVYYPVLFYIRAIQTVLVLLVVPLFLTMGKPISLAIAAAPRVGRPIEAVIRSKVARVLAFPAIVSLVLIVTPFVLYFTPWYVAGFHSTLVRQLTYLALMAPGLAFFWLLLQVDPVPHTYPYAVLLWISVVEVIGDAVLGLAIMLEPTLIAPAYYHALARPWGPSPLTDQVVGGGAIWLIGDIVGLPFAAAQLIQMIRADESEAAEIDAELDARDAELAAAGGTSPGGTPGTLLTGADRSETQSGSAQPAGGTVAAAPPGQRPWWETDPRFADRFRAVDEGGDSQ